MNVPHKHGSTSAACPANQGLKLACPDVSINVVLVEPTVSLPATSRVTHRACRNWCDQEHFRHHGAQSSQSTLGPRLDEPKRNWLVNALPAVPGRCLVAETSTKTRRLHLTCSKIRVLQRLVGIARRRQPLRHHPMAGHPMDADAFQIFSISRPTSYVAQQF